MRDRKPVTQTNTPASRKEFGEALRRLRRPLGLRSLEGIQETGTYPFVISRSQLSCYETAKVLPPLDYAAHLDDLYGGKGWIAMTLRNLWRSDWNPWTVHEHGFAQRLHADRWPAPYTGTVWIKLKPLPASVGQNHQFRLDWGSWYAEVEADLHAEGIVIMTGKARDENGESVTCNLTASQRTFALFGAGDDLDDEHVIDIRQIWQWRS